LAFGNRKALDLLARGHLPKTNGAILAPGGQAFAVSRESNRQSTATRREMPQFLARRHPPKAQALGVRTGRGQQRAIRGKCEFINLREIRPVPTQTAEKLPSSRLPETNGSVA